MKPMLLASDMDGTVIPLDHGETRNLEIAQLKQALTSSSNISLAYVSGRDLVLALEGIEHYNLPEPEFIVGDVGTSLYRFSGGEWHQDMLFRESLRERWKGLSASQIISQLGPLGSLDLQEDHKQSEFKASYYCPIDHLNKGIVKKIEERLSEIEQEASIVCSIDPIAKCGLVDLLPPGITKDFAVRFLQKLLKLSAEDVVYAGDSGNDLAVFLSDYKSILVGNTPESIKEQVKEEAKAKGALEKHYFAKQPYAAGVLEGLKAFAWIG